MKTSSELIKTPNKKDKIKQVWKKAKKLSIFGDVRQDKYGNEIRFSEYGKRSKYGWEIDHKHPKAKGGSDKDRNLQPLHWKENRRKRDKYPYAPKKKRSIFSALFEKKSKRR